MICNGYDKVFDLENGELIELTDARGTTLRVTKGTLWVTQERDRNDIVLRTGDVWTVERDGLTLAEAQGDATFCVAGGSAHRVVPARAPSTFVARVDAFIETLARARFGGRFVPYV